jgi:glycosyltransferase involved in cell wall biosynthesis
MPDPKLSVVLPCYNESAGLSDILERFLEAGRDRDFELVLVDNGSTDDTPKVLAELLPRYPFARSVAIERNRGYGDGIDTGLKQARGEIVAWSHADLQTDPADVFRAWDVFAQADDPSRLLVKGRRHGRRPGEWIISRGMEVVALLLLRRWIPEINAQPKLFHRGLLEHVTNPPVDFNFDVYVLYRAKRCGWRIASIDVAFPPRPHGQSHWAATFRSRMRTIARSMRYMFLLGLGLAR